MFFLPIIYVFSGEPCGKLLRHVSTNREFCPPSPEPSPFLLAVLFEAFVNDRNIFFSEWKGLWVKKNFVPLDSNARVNQYSQSFIPLSNKLLNSLPASIFLLPMT